MPEAVIIGVGNILLKDEGVGIYAAKYIDENFLFSPSIDIIDGGTIGYRLINYLQGYDKVFILDTISADDEPGSIYSMPSEALMGMGHYRRTAHEVEVVEMLEICSLTETMAEVNVIGIVPEDIKNVGIDLTDKMLKRAEDRIRKIKWNNFKLININASEYVFNDKVNAVISTFALTMIPEYEKIIKNISSALEPGSRFVVCDFKKHEQYPDWLINFGVFITKPFGVLLDLADRKPWKYMKEYFSKVEVKEIFGGFAYIAVGIV